VEKRWAAVWFGSEWGDEKAVEWGFVAVIHERRGLMVRRWSSECKDRQVSD
jgi:hypothetical protein